MHGFQTHIYEIHVRIARFLLTFDRFPITERDICIIFQISQKHSESGMLIVYNIHIKLCVVFSQKNEYFCH